MKLCNIETVFWEMSRIDCKDWQFSRFHVCRFCKKKKKIENGSFGFLITFFFLLAFHLFILGKQIEFYESIFAAINLNKLVSTFYYC